MMGHRCCSKQKVKRGLWSPEEDERLANYITTNGHGSWSSVPRLAGLQRCGKSCRLRWINYLRPDLKRGTFSAQEEQIIIDVHRILGNRWAQIANHLPGRTDNEVKNFWNSCIKKKLMAHGLDPRTHNLIPARLRSHNHHSTLTTTKSGGSSQQPFSIITVKGHSTPESDPPLSSMNLSSLQDDHQNPDMLWSTDMVDQGFPASWAPTVDSDMVHEQSPEGYGLLVESSSAPQNIVTQQQAQNVHGQTWWTHTEEGEGVRVGGGSQQGGAMGSDIRAEEEEMIRMGTTSSSFDCFDMEDPSFLSSSICRDLTSMDIIDLPWNF